MKPALVTCSLLMSLVDHARALVPLGHFALVAVRRIAPLGDRHTDGAFTAVVDQQREIEIAVVLAHQRAEIPEPDAKVRLPLVQRIVADARP